MKSLATCLVQAPCISASQYVTSLDAHGLGSAHVVEGEADAEGHACVVGGPRLEKDIEPVSLPSIREALRGQTHRRCGSETRGRKRSVTARGIERRMVLDDQTTLKRLLPPIFEVAKVKLRIHLIRVVPDNFALLRSCASPACDALTVRYILGARPECAARIK